MSDSESVIVELHRDLNLFKQLRTFTQVDSAWRARVEFRISAINEVLNSLPGRDDRSIKDESISTRQADT